MPRQGNNILGIKTIDIDGFAVEFEVINKKEIADSRKKEIEKSIDSIDEQINKFKDKENLLDNEIDRLTNHADVFDYTISVATGVLCGLIDSFVIGEFDFRSAKAKSNRQVNDFIMAFAKSKGFSGERLNDAISFLEKQYPVPNDSIFKNIPNIGTKNHHLADFAHHPTLLGLIASIFSQLFRCGFFVNREGEWNIVTANLSKEKLLEIWIPIIISGILLWLVNIAESKYIDKIDEHIPKPIRNLIKILATTPALISIFKVAGNWAGHLVSDMGGSKNTAGGGMGIPGLFISLLHEMSSLPILKNTSLPKVVNDLYTKQKFDFRSEIAILNELGRQAIPVLLGDILVRTFYFVRHLIKEFNENNKEFSKINWQNVVPFKNRTIVRMMAIESATFTAIDLADAAIRSSIKNGGIPLGPQDPRLLLFLKDFILRVNFVGIGKFVIEIGTDIGMGIKRSSLVKERMHCRNNIILLNTAKIFYMQKGTWLEAIETEKAMKEMYVIAENSIHYYAKCWQEIVQSIDKIGDYVPSVEKNNPGLIDEMKDVLKWGD